MKIIFLTLFLLFHSTLLFGFDLSTKVSYIQSTYDVEFIDDSIKQNTVGLTIAISKDLGLSTSTFFAYTPAVSINNNEISRHIFGVGLEYTLFGQTRHLHHNYRFANVDYYGAGSLYMPLSVNYNLFQVELEGRSGKLKGNIIQIETGLGYRYELSKYSSMSIELGSSLSSFSNGSGSTTAADRSVRIGFTGDFDELSNLFSHF